MGAFSPLRSDAPIPVVLVGAGGMGRAWMRTLEASSDVDLVGVVDLDVDRASQALEEERIAVNSIGDSTSRIATDTGARAVINVTVPGAHRAVNEEALRAGLAVLCEKPISPTLAEALSQVALAEVTGQLLMVSQSRRYYNALAALRGAATGLGDLGVVTTQFFKAPHFGGFRDEMDQPLLVDMAIHQFDAARYLIGKDPVSVSCTSWNPRWSWYRGDAAATAEFEFEGGIRYIYTGSWCAEGLETSWNGAWRISGEGGSVSWDGENAPVGADGPISVPLHGEEEIAGSLAEFVRALRTGETPSGEVHSNVPSLAMVEGAVTSAATGRRVSLPELSTSALTQALADETAADVRNMLATWHSANDDPAQPWGPVH